jgi:hypothetical protein
MSYLLYCLRRHPGPALAAPGVGGAPVYPVSHRGWQAVVSRIRPADLVPDLPRVRRYIEVVLACHRQGPIIPMRYGCVVEQESQVRQLLDTHGPDYETILQELEGCVEMGLRVLLPSGPGEAATLKGEGGSREVTESPPWTPPPAPARPGAAYLTARQAHYAHQDRWTREYSQAAARCRAQFAGLFVRCHTEAPSPRLPLLSLYFLVARPALAPFRQAFRELAETEPAHLLLSGPWPPFNFVMGGPFII